MEHIESIIALQECPYPNFGSELFTSLGYVSADTPRQSHCGYCDLLIQKELISNKIQPIQLPNHIPSVAAKIELPNKKEICISSSHLQPFKEGANKRLLQCMSLMDCMTKESNNCILRRTCTKLKPHIYLFTITYHHLLTPLHFPHH